MAHGKENGAERPPATVMTVVLWMKRALCNRIAFSPRRTHALQLHVPAYLLVRPVRHIERAESVHEGGMLKALVVPPWLPAKSARVSSLLACCALGPPAFAALYSCRRELCTDRSAWLPLGRACPSACIEPRSGGRRSP